MRIILRRIFTKRHIVILVLIGFMYLVGYLTARYEVFPYKYLHKALDIVDPPSKLKNISTIFINLNVVRNKVPVSRKASGGGLTSFGDELLLITPEGNIFLANEDEIKQTNIESADNGFEKYVAAAKSEKFRNLTHNFSRFRYNDLLYYSEGSRHGLVVSYTNWHSDQECYDTTIAQLELASDINSIMEVEAISEDWKIVYQTKPCLELKSVWRALEGHMAGGRIAYVKPHKIVLGSGDYHWDGVYAPAAYAQMPDKDYGKVLEIDLNEGTARKISMGNRNMQGILVDSDGQIWITEHGPRGGDELNRIVDGGNYGWPLEILGTRYNKLPWPLAADFGRHDRYISPIYAWVPSVAISNLTQIEGFHPSWNGDLLASSLSGKTLFRLRIKENRVVFAEPIKIGERIRYAHQHTDGRIVLWTDNKNLLFLSAGQNTSTSKVLDKLIANSDYSDVQKKKIESAISSCGECHSFDMHDHELAPGLGAVFGSAIGSTRYAYYSDSFRSRSGVWTADELTKFLRDPQAYVPGTSMPDSGIEDQFVLDGIVEILQKIKTEAH